MKPILALAALLLSACATAPPIREPAPLAADAPFRDEILRFAALDRESAPPVCPVLFIGSSSIRMWTGLAADMAPLPILNRAFGGSTTRQVNDNFDRVVTPYRPRAIVLYAGDNDIDSGVPSGEVLAQFERFLALKSDRLGDVPVFYISVKPSKARLAQLPRQLEVNAAVLAIAARRSDVEYVDIATPMLSGGQPRDLFLEDGLHMTAAGYAIWREKVGEALRRRQVERLRCRR